MQEGPSSRDANAHTHLFLQLKHLSVLLAFPAFKFFRVLPHLLHQVFTLDLHGLKIKIGKVVLNAVPLHTTF